jgi:hypothetical protein
MESFSPAASPLAPRRAARIAQVKFMALAIEARDPSRPRILGPDPRNGPGAAPPRPGARLLSFLARIAFRVIGRPVAARP